MNQPLSSVFDMPAATDIAWCPGCGNFAVLRIVKRALEELGLTPKEVALVSGIGQAAKLPQYANAHMFNGLHGRSLPAATAIKLANPKLKVLANSGDGCMLGEGGNHFIHTIRRNPGIVAMIHDNRVYGLTKGQAAPTAARGLKTKLQVDGVFNEPLNPLALAISLNASFVARTFCGDQDFSVQILKQALTHRGFAIVDIFAPCVTYNKVNTYAWFKENTYALEATHPLGDRAEAFRRALETDRLPVGVFYKDESRPTLEEHLGLTAPDAKPLYDHQVHVQAIKERMGKFR